MKNILFILLLTISVSAFAQDAFLSNYPQNILFYNPAYAGVDSMKSFSLSARRQWNIYNSVTLTYDQRLNKIHSGIGAILTYENNGSAPVEEYHSALCYNYNLQFNDKMNLRIGAQAGFDYQLTHAENLIFGAHWNGTGYDTTSFGPLSDFKYGYFDFGAGAYYVWQNLHAGFSVHHLAYATVINSPGESGVVATSYIGTSGYDFHFGKNIINTPSVLVMQQGPNKYLQGSDDVSIKQTFFLGAGYRGNQYLNVLVARAGLRLKNKFQLMFCYDFGISEPALIYSKQFYAYEANLKYFFR